MVKVYRSDLEGFYDVSEERARELEKVGYSREPQGAEVSTGGSTIQFETALATARSLYAFFPESVLRKYADAWIKYDDTQLAIAETRNSSEWKSEFGFLRRADGSLIMSEAEAMSAKASYAETLSEVGIKDFSDFQDEFESLIKNEVSGAEFQQRIVITYAGVVNLIPEVESLFRDRYNIDVDEPTIFGALINPKIQDKVLAGEIQTLQLQAEASSRGFTTSFSRFQELKNRGLSKEQARGIYQTAGQTISQAESIGRELDISTLEEATLGDTNATKRLQRISAELQSKQGIQLGAAKISDEVTGLIAD